MIFLNNKLDILTISLYGQRTFTLNFSCKKEVLNAIAPNDFYDIFLAEPWFKEIKLQEKAGQSLFSCRTKEGEVIINNMIKQKAIICSEISEGTIFCLKSTPLNGTQTIILPSPQNQKLDDAYISF